MSWILNTNTVASFMLPDAIHAEDESPELIAELQTKLTAARLVEETRFKIRLANAKEYAVPFPEVALKGSLAALANLLFKDSEVPIEFGFMAAVTMFGLIAAEKLHIANDSLDTATNLYTVLLTPTGGKKSSAAIALRKFFMQLDTPLLTHDTTVLGAALCLSSADSGEGIMKVFQPSEDMATARNRVLFIIDEFEALMHKSRQQNNTMGPVLTSLFDTRFAGNTTAKKTKSINNAYLSIISCTTINAWMSLWSEGKERGTGLMNRLFLVSSLPRPKVFQPSLPESTQLLELRKRISAQYGKLNYGKPLTITPTARLIFDNFYLTLDSSREEATRIENIIKRLAMILAATCDKTSIDADIATMAVALGEYQFEVRKLLNPSEAKNVMAVCENALTAFLRQHADDPTPITKNRILNRLGTLVREHGIAMVMNALKSLVTYGAVEEYGVEGAKAARYRLREGESS